MKRALAAVMLLSPGMTVAAQQRPAVLDTLTVVASRTHTGDAARSIDIITRDEIARSSARTIADVLSTVMGVDVLARSAAQADVSIRGGTAEQVVVLVDGVRVSDVQSAHYTLDLAVPLESVERIAVLRGVGSALYGPDAVGGVIDIVTRRTAPTSAHASTGSFGTVGGGFTTGVSRGRSAIGASADLEKSDGHRDGTDHRIGRARLTTTLPLGHGTLRTNGGLGIRDFGAADFYAPYNSVERTATTTLDSRWDAHIGAWTLQLAGATRRHQDHYVLVRDDPARYENRHQSWQTGGEVVARRDAGAATVALGAEGAHDQLSSRRLGGRREWRGALFAEGSVRAAHGLMANLGVRGDHSSAYGDFFSPSLSVAAAVGDWLTIRGNAGLGFRAPTWTERYYTDPANVGDPSLAPERFRSGELGARAAWHGWTADVSAYARRATRLIDWVKPAAATSAPWRSTNVGEATYRGLEAELEMPVPRWIAATAFGSWLALDAEGASDLVGKYALRPLTRQAGLRLATAPRRRLGAQLELVHAQRVHERAYTTGNARVWWARHALRVVLDVRNLAEATWLDASGRPAASRGIYGGIEWLATP